MILMGNMGKLKALYPGVGSLWQLWDGPSSVSNGVIYSLPETTRLIIVIRGFRRPNPIVICYTHIYVYRGTIMYTVCMYSVGYVLSRLCFFDSNDFVTCLNCHLFILWAPHETCDTIRLHIESLQSWFVRKLTTVDCLQCGSQTFQ